MNKKLLLLVLSVVCVGWVSAQESYKYLSLDMKRMEDVRSTEADRNERTGWIKRADEQLKKGPYSVTYKKVLPPSGDKHDYISMGPYWWPNPKTADGLPYVRRDGERNPERNKYSDSGQLSKVIDGVFTLGNAYYYTNDERYAKKAFGLVDTFFVNPATRMNPNLKYGQFIPGICEGRGIGIIETRFMGRLLEGITLMHGAESWDKHVYEGLKRWIRDYLTWLQTHPYGIDESKAHNNHGTYYDVQCVAMNLFLGQVDEAKRLIVESTQKRLQKQVAKDGSQPYELERTNSWSYATMNLQGFILMAKMGEKIGVDLWHYTHEGQMYLKSMIDWFVPFLKKEKVWTWKQIGNAKVEAMADVLRTAAFVYGDRSYSELADNLKPIHEHIQ